MMKHLRISAILLLLCLLVGAVSASAQDLEQYLPSEAAVWASVNNIGEHLARFDQTPIFASLAAIHRQEKPNKPPLKELLGKIRNHPFYRLVKNQVVLGIIPEDKELKTKTIFVALGVSDEVDKNMQAFINEESKKEKLHILNQGKYQSAILIEALQPEKGKLGKRYFLMTPTLFVVSNDKKQATSCYDRYVEKNAGLQLPASYQNVGRPLFKAGIDFSKLQKQLAAIKPKKQDIPRQYFDNFKKILLATRNVVLSLRIEDRVSLQLLREHDGQSMVPAFAIPQGLIDNRTLAFLAAPIPYPLLWFGFKKELLRKSPRKLREVEARLNEFFNWVCFEKDIVPKIGPATGLLLKRPAILEGKSLYLPSLVLLLALDHKLNLQTPLNKLWQMAQKNPKVTNHLKTEKKIVQGNELHVFNFIDTPIDGLLTPSIAFPSGWLVLGSHFPEIAEIISVLQHPKASQSGHTYFYVNFQVLAELLRANKSFLKKQAKKKGKPFSEQKAERFMGLLRFFEYLELSGKTAEKCDIFDWVLQLSK